VDAVIQLPADLFFGTSIGTCILVLKKSKADNRTLFIDASSEFDRISTKNVLTPEHRTKILESYINRVDQEHFAALVDNSAISANDCNLSVSSYVEQGDTREVIDIVELNTEIERIVARQAELRIKIEAIVNNLEGDN
jgi:type I restriction enzyme M protein